ncbi:MAG: hypothetical protein ACI8QC_001983 [Planctomycetota bacterium]|jgi:hypothetical protein
MKKHLFRSAVLCALANTAFTQVQPIASDSFDYPHPGLLINQAGGSGWLNPWDVVTLGNEIVIFDQTVNPVFASADNVGNYIGQAQEWGTAGRQPNNNHPDVVEAGSFGKDGAVIWFSFTTVAYQQFGTHRGGMALLQAGGAEQIFIGSPWASNGWGVYSDPANNVITTVAGSDDTQDAHIVVRIDHQAGDERLRFWLDPASDYPSTPADLDFLIPDLRWDEIRFSSGGSGSHYFWDNLKIAKGEPTTTGLGINYCSPATNNTTGQPGIIVGTGSDVASDMDLTLTGTQLPPNEFAYFLGSLTQGLITNPGGSQGDLCVVGSIARFNTQIGQVNSLGEFSIVVDTQNIPVSPIVAIAAGDTWNFQCWHRDFIQGQGPTSNFTDAVSILFQ